MATVVELTQVQIAPTSGGGNGGSPTGLYWVQGSEQPISINQQSIAAVGYYWDMKNAKIIQGIVIIYLTGLPQMTQIVVTDSYATVAAYIAANP